MACSLTLTWSGNCAWKAKSTGVHKGKSLTKIVEWHSIRASNKPKKCKLTISAKTLEWETSWRIPGVTLPQKSSKILPGNKICSSDALFPELGVMTCSAMICSR